MTVSTDYESDYMQVFKEVSEELSPLIDGDTTIKTARIEICFQTSEPGTLWGRVTSDKNYTVQEEYPVTVLNNLSDAKVVAYLKEALEESKSEVTFNAQVAQELAELSSHLKMEKYPILLSLLHMGIRQLDDEDLFALIHLSIGALPDENPLKIRMEAFYKLPIQSSEVQGLLALVRRRINAISSDDLFHKIHTILSLFAQHFEDERKVHQEQEETIQLPMDSEKVRQMIALARAEILQNNKNNETSKLINCYRQAVAYMQNSPGENKLSSVNVKLLYIKGSNPDHELIYEKKFSNRSLEFQQAT
jgi:hypothetical protein